MAKEEKVIKVEQKIISLKLIDFKLSVLEESEVKKINKEKIIFEFNIQYVGEGNNRINITVVTKFFADGKVVEIGNMKTQAVFEVANLEDILNKFNNQIPTPILT